ncbi:MAG TPA: AAA family ATPase [Oligoflexia bacterium]|nr:AAA family ATPase [Oligoflexia bacterium]HMP27435.1 AAA family ATPase [Oligoflexia bacterium]
MAEIITVVNQKGGVGKTTTSVNLGAAFAQLNKKVLLIDIDAQCNLTTHLGIKSIHDEEDPPEGSQFKVTAKNSIYELLKGTKNIKECITNRSKNIDVIIANLLLSAADLELGGIVGRELILKRAIETIKDNYDYIVIDCPPALGLLSLNALAAGNKVIIPVQSEYLALHGVRQLLDTIDQVRSIYNPTLSVQGVLICLHDNRKRLARAVSDTIRAYFGDLVFNSVIKTNVALAEAPASGDTIFEYAPKSSGAEDYMALAKEIIG